MGFIGDLFDTTKGTGFQAKGTNILQPTTAGDYQNAMAQSQGGIGQQQQFLNALQSQGGIGNQANVFAQQQALANQLGQQAAGGGPNPALAQLQGTTGQNIANQSAMMAGQRGVGANAGMMARQIANQGAGIQQQANNQAAVMRAQQQLAAQGALQQQHAQMGSLAGQQVGQQQAATAGLNSMQQGYQNAIGGQNQSQNQANVAMQSGMNNANAAIAGVNAKNQSDLLGGIAKGGASALMMAAGIPPIPMGATGGMITNNGFVKNYAEGTPPGGVPAPAAGYDPMSFVSQYSQAASSQPMSQSSSQIEGAGKSIGNLFGGLAGKAMPAGMGADSVNPETYQWATMSEGGHVPGKAIKHGDSLANDIVPAMLSPGEVVIPRSKVNDPDATAKFINAVLGYNLSAKKK